VDVPLYGGLNAVPWVRAVALNPVTNVHCKGAVGLGGPSVRSRCCEVPDTATRRCRGRGEVRWCGVSQG
jgi:hypothetical protein